MISLERSEIERIWHAYRWGDLVRDDFVPSEPTETPGIFYHGSPNLHLDRFESRVTRWDGNRTVATFFTQSPSYAAIYAAGRACFLRRKHRGRIFRAELITRNPCFVDGGKWAEATGSLRESRAAESDLCEQGRALGYDCIITSTMGGAAIAEIIVLDTAVVKPLESLAPSRWLLDEYAARGFFYTAEDMSGEPWADGCTHLSSARNGSGRSVVAEPLKPIYCARATWPEFNLDTIREFSANCLIDPSDGAALVLDPALVRTVNRAERRALRASQISGV